MEGGYRCAPRFMGSRAYAARFMGIYFSNFFITNYQTPIFDQIIGSLMHFLLIYSTFWTKSTPTSGQIFPIMFTIFGEKSFARVIGPLFYNSFGCPGYAQNRSAAHL